MIKPMTGIAVLSLLAGCAPEPVSNAVQNSGIAANATEIIVPPEANPAEANASNATEAAGAAVNLAPDELTLVLPNGSSRHVGFATEKAAAIRMLSAVLGNPIEQASSRECGAGALDHAAFREGLSLYFQDDRFVGWDLDGEGAKFTTGNGIGIGATRKALEAAGEVTVEETTIGHEFTIGGMSGLLSSPGPDGKVTNLWAGVTCIAR